MLTGSVLRFKVQFPAEKVKVRPLETRVCLGRYVKQRGVIIWESGLDSPEHLLSRGLRFRGLRFRGLCFRGLRFRGLRSVVCVFEVCVFETPM